jgi:hypothetical protein
MMKFLSCLSILLLFSLSVDAQWKREDLTISEKIELSDEVKPLLFPNPSIMGQDIFILSGSLMSLDGRVLITDQSGKEIKGISTSREGGRIRVHGQVPKPGIYMVTYGQGGYQFCQRWVVR